MPAHRSESDKKPDIKPISTTEQSSDEKSECKSEWTTDATTIIEPESKSDEKSDENAESCAHDERTDSGAIRNTTVYDVHESVSIHEQSVATQLEAEGQLLCAE